MISFKLLAVFLVVMWLGMWIGQELATILPTFGNVLVDGAISFAIVMIPGFAVFIYLQKKQKLE